MIFGRLQSKFALRILAKPNYLFKTKKTPEHCQSHENLKKQMEIEYTEPKAYVNIQAE